MDVKVNGKFVDIDLPSLLLLEKKVAIEGVRGVFRGWGGISPP